jgi:4'-phosphopantetheinyl transferase EntD
MRLSPEAVAALARPLLPPDVALAVERIGPADLSALWPEERPAVLGAVPARRDEFVAGRRAARRVLSSLGLPEQALPMAPDRAATWPHGVSGTIAHAAGFAIAAARLGGPIGIDIEDDSPIPPDLWSVICSSEEVRRLGEDHTGQKVKQVFCAKEAVFKAQSPDARVLFGFEVLDVTLAERSFNAQFRADAGSFRKGQVLTGRLALGDGVILAGVAWSG